MKVQFCIWILVTHTKLPTIAFVAVENRLPWQQRGISISQLSEGVGGPDLV